MKEKARRIDNEMVIDEDSLAPAKRGSLDVNTDEEEDSPSKRLKFA